MIVLINSLENSFPNLFTNQVVLHAVHGFNQTDTLLKLLDTGLQFHNLSKGGRNWGKLATWLTKYRSLQYQVEHGIKFAVTIEDDVVPDVNWDVVMLENSSSSIVKYSAYGEVYSTTLTAAYKTLLRLQNEGILKNDDQQFFWSDTIQKRYKNVFRLKRKTNRGVIIKTPAMTWMEMAMLRKITHSKNFEKTYLGNPKNYRGRSCWSKHEHSC